jgi:hypothetical protein
MYILERYIKLGATLGDDFATLGDNSATLGDVLATLGDIFNFHTYRSFMKFENSIFSVLQHLETFAALASVNFCEVIRYSHIIFTVKHLQKKVQH